MSKGNHRTRRLHFEGLESRLALSLSFGAEFSDHHNPGHGGGPPGGGDPDPPDTGGGIDLPTVALHEFGHSLGLPHSNVRCGEEDQSLMCPFYIGPAGLQPEDVSDLQALYSGADTDDNWSDPNITYSFVPDGTRMDRGRSTLFSKMNNEFGSAAVWQPIFADALNVWADATGGFLAFSEASDDGSPDGTTTLAPNGQGDARFGDIRIGAHSLGGGGTLAHAATLGNFSTTNSSRGDAHFNKSVDWGIVDGFTSSASGNSKGSTGGHGRFAAMSHAAINGSPDLTLQAASDLRYSYSNRVVSNREAGADESTQHRESLDEWPRAANVDAILADRPSSSHMRGTEELNLGHAPGNQNDNLSAELFEDLDRLLSDNF